jgi:hypothetical protein
MDGFHTLDDVEVRRVPAKRISPRRFSTLGRDAA